MSMRFMQRHQEKVRSTAVSAVAPVKTRADTSAAPVSDKPAASSASTAPAKRVAPVLGRRSFGGFNPHIQVPSSFTALLHQLFSPTSTTGALRPINSRQHQVCGAVLRPHLLQILHLHPSRIIFSLCSDHLRQTSSSLDPRSTWWKTLKRTQT